MRDSELKPDRIVFVETCAICGKEMSRQNPKAWISVRYKDSGGAAISAHADCVRPLLLGRAKSLLDPEKLASDADGLDP
jgi:hypothetical protein